MTGGVTDSQKVPKAIVATVAANTVLGLVFLIPLVFVLPDIDMLIALANGQPVPTIIKMAVGPEGAIALLMPLMVLALLCGVSCTTAASRCTWAFARDGAIPGSRWWSKIHPKLGVPLNAMMLSMTVQILLSLIYFGSSEAFNAFLGVSIICLTVANAAPIAVNVVTGRKAVSKALFKLRWFGLPANIIALGASLPAPSPLPAVSLTLSLMPTAPSRVHRWLTSRSVVPLCDTPLLHADGHTCGGDDSQLRPCCVLRRLVDIGRVVHRVGLQELQGSAGPRAGVLGAWVSASPCRACCYYAGPRPPIHVCVHVRDPQRQRDGPPPKPKEPKCGLRA
ncbi:amino acid permease [Candidatus Bathyarchaeota archaeon]|nr:amino acid permease [Candidatus Bathyarchaeota archaeon]